MEAPALMKTEQTWHGFCPFAAATAAAAADDDDIQNVFCFVVLLGPGSLPATHQMSRLHIDPRTLKLFHPCKGPLGPRVSEQ